MVEGDVELPGLQVDRIGGCGGGIQLQILRFELGDQVVQCTTNVGEEAVVLFLNGIGEDVVFLKQMPVVHVQGGQLVFTHCVNLLNVNELSVRGSGYATVGCGGRCQCNLFGESVCSLAHAQLAGRGMKMVWKSDCRGTSGKLHVAEIMRIH